MIILGIDPGIAIVGWGVIEYERGQVRAIDYGSILTDKDLSVEERLRLIHEQLEAIINRHKPSCMAIEELFWNTNQKTGIVVAEARGVIICLAHRMGLDIFEYTPLQAKQAITGYGRADKKQVQQMVMYFLGLDKVPQPDDAADGLAAAICHAHTAKLGTQFKIK